MTHGESYTLYLSMLRQTLENFGQTLGFKPTDIEAIEQELGLTSYSAETDRLIRIELINRYAETPIEVTQPITECASSAFQVIL